VNYWSIYSKEANNFDQVLIPVIIILEHPGTIRIKYIYMNKLVLAISINILITLSAFAEANTYVISSNKALIDEVSPSILKGILIGKKTYWDSGDRVKLCHIITSNNDFKRLLKRTINMSADQYLNLWRRKLFTGRGFPPTQLKTEKDIINCVKENSSAIGIVSKKISNQEIFQSLSFI